MAHEMADAAEKLIRKRYSKEILIDIVTVKEPDNMAMGNASGIM